MLRLGTWASSGVGSLHMSGTIRPNLLSPQVCKCLYMLWLRVQGSAGLAFRDPKP